jgi:hypothetical protein
VLRVVAVFHRLASMAALAQPSVALAAAAAAGEAHVRQLKAEAQGSVSGLMHSVKLDSLIAVAKRLQMDGTACLHRGQDDNAYTLLMRMVTILTYAIPANPAAKLPQHEHAMLWCRRAGEQAVADLTVVRERIVRRVAAAAAAAAAPAAASASRAVPAQPQPQMATGGSGRVDEPSAGTEGAASASRLAFSAGAAPVARTNAPLAAGGGGLLAAAATVSLSGLERNDSDTSCAFPTLQAAAAQRTALAPRAPGAQAPCATTPELPSPVGPGPAGRPEAPSNSYGPGGSGTAAAQALSASPYAVLHRLLSCGSSVGALGLRPLHVPLSIIDAFVNVSAANTARGERGVETCGILAGVMVSVAHRSSVTLVHLAPGSCVPLDLRGNPITGPASVPSLRPGVTLPCMTLPCMTLPCMTLPCSAQTTSWR